MGGTALGVACRRLDKVEYEEMTREALCKLREIGFEAVPVPAHRSKRDFGDIDILVSGGREDRGKIVEHFGSEVHVSNGDCLSLLWKGAQLDVVSVEHGETEVALGYFSWPDLGNFIGKIARAAGLKYGHRGLCRWVSCERSGKRFAAKVSTSTSDIHQFFGLSHQRWLEGFDSPADIYEFVAGSPLFSKSLFQADALDHRSRVRNRKRPVYRGLLEWAEDNTSQGFDYSQVDRKWWDRRTTQHFGEAWELEAEGWRRQEDLRRLVAEKFNGKIVTDLTGLAGPDLGRFIQGLKAGKGGGFDEWVARATPEKIKNLIGARFADRNDRGQDTL
jgi:hypothetical protein